ncbi:MAG: YfhO family protein [Candidatus Omnitrophota bacterium]
MLIPLVVFRAALLTGQPLKPVGDCFFLDYPFRLLAWESIRHGEIPFWNPYNSGGMNLLGQPFFFLIYPFYDLIYLFSKQNIFFVLSLVQIIHITIALLGMYFLLKRIVRNKPVSFWGAILYGFSYAVIAAFSIGQLLVSYAFLPWIVLFIYGFEKRHVFVNIGGLAVLLFLLAGGGFPQWTLFTLFIVFLFLVFRSNPLKDSQRKTCFLSLKIFFSALLLAFLLGAIEFIPFLEQNLQGARGNGQFLSQNTQQNWITPWFLSFRLFVPNLFNRDLQSFVLNPMVFLADNFHSYYGIVPALLSLLAFFMVRKRWITVWKIIFCVVFLIALGLPVITHIFSMFFMKADLVHTRIGSFLPFLGVVLAAAMLRSILISIRKALMVKSILMAASALLLMACLWFSLWGRTTFGADLGVELIEKQLLIAAALTFLAAILFFLLGRGLLGRKLFLLFFFAMTFVDIGYFSLGENEDRRSIRPTHEYFSFSQGEKLLTDLLGNKKTQYRIHDASARMGEISNLSGGPYMHYFPNGNVYNKFYEANGYILNMPKDVGQFLTCSSSGFFIRMADVLTYQSLPTLLSMKYFIVPAWCEPSSYRLAPSRHYKVIREFTDGPPERKFDFKIIEFENIPPRFFFTKQIKTGVDREKIFDLVTKENFDPREVTYFEKYIPEGRFDVSRQRVLSVDVPSANRVVLRVEVAKPGILVMNNFWHPWWRVKINGRKKALYRANFIFQAIEIPEGTSTVSFYCTAKSLKVGAGLSAAGIFCLCVLFGLHLRRRRLLARKNLV